MSRSGLISTLIVMAILVMTVLLAAPARAQDAARPPVGGVISPPDAMIFYLARGPDGACGPNCSEWVAAEGVVEWKQMGVGTDVVGMIEQNSATSRATQISRADWPRLGIITAPVP